MNISAAICHGTHRPRRKDGTEKSTCHSPLVRCHFHGYTLCRKECVCCCDFYMALRGERWDVLHLGHVLVAPVHIWSKSAFFGAGGLSRGADKAPSSWLSLLCHQQIGGPCGTLHHCSSIFGRKLRWIWEVRSVWEVWPDQPLADKTHLKYQPWICFTPLKTPTVNSLNPDRSFCYWKSVLSKLKFWFKIFHNLKVQAILQHPSSKRL